MNAAAAKDKEHEIWTSVTPGWRKHDAELVAWAAPVSAKLLGLAGVAPGSKVLDIACGTGEPAIPAARLAGPSGSVLGLDFVEEMLVFAREKAAREGLKNIEFKRQDGEACDAPEAAFDAATIRFGLMFMPEPRTCLAAARRALKPGGRIAVATWAGPELNPWAATALGVLKRRLEVPAPPPGTPGLFALADPRRLASLLTEAGFQGAEVEALPVRREFKDGAGYFQFIIELAGPLALLFSKLPAEQRPGAADEIAAEAEKFRQGGRLEIGGSAWVASAAK